MVDTMKPPLNVAERDSFALVVLTALVRQSYCLSSTNADHPTQTVHFVFNRWEPLHLIPVSTLLLILPVLFSTLLIPYYSTVSGIGIGLLTFYATLASSIALYRISPFHPIARYPGPFLSKMTKLWHVWQTLNGKQHLYLRRMHERYGDVVRIGKGLSLIIPTSAHAKTTTGPNEISISDATCITPLMGSLGCPKGPREQIPSHFYFRKCMPDRFPVFNGRHFWPKVPSLIGFQDSAAHQLRRRPWNRAFNTASLKEFQPRIQHRVHQLVDALEERHGQVLDLAQWIGFFTYDSLTLASEFLLMSHSDMISWVIWCKSDLH